MARRSVSAGRTASLARARCPICGKPANPDMRPFCSRSCADADLMRWLDGAYRIPGAERPGLAGDDDES